MNEPEAIKYTTSTCKNRGYPIQPQVPSITLEAFVSTSRSRHFANSSSACRSPYVRSLAVRKALTQQQQSV
jgi:hypothetical protein